MKLRESLLAAGLAMSHLLAGEAAEPSVPNILWITVEDMSANLGCYGDAYATTPHLDAFARQAVRYTRAFATAPVCSPARSCLITGVYATSLGTQRLRSAFPIPARFQGFPSDLRKAGYYTSNNVKTDYNTANEPALIQASWNACSVRADWRGRAPGEPFFSVINLMTTHQSRTSVWSFEEFEQQVGARLAAGERHDPARAPLPPYYPDTALARRTVARYYDCITAMDKEVGDILARLEADGLAGDTIVFFYSDHGMGMPRGKRVLHDSGLHVPLLIRFPEKWASLAPATAGETVGSLVSFVDFAPTVLSLAGLEIPDYMQGTAFLGSRIGAPRSHVFGARDRVDEADDLARSVRDGRWLYIRNYQSHLSWMQRERYSDQSVFRRELLQLAADGQLEGAPMTYAAPRRTVEELYDTVNDPHQVHNLAGLPGHREVLERLRNVHRHWVFDTRDLGFLPEIEASRVTEGTTPYAWARAADNWPGDVFAAAERAGSVPSAVVLADELQSSNSAIRHWAVTTFLADPAGGSIPESLLDQCLQDCSANVRVPAALIAIRQGRVETGLEVLEKELAADGVDRVLAAARAVESLGNTARLVRPALRAALDRATTREGEHPGWMFVRFAIEEIFEIIDRQPAA